MGRIRSIGIERFRSINEYIEVDVPVDGPLVLLGENSVGKSNIVKAIDILFGEGWPGSYQPEDHEFFGRDPDNGPISIAVEVDGVTSRHGPIERFVWKYDPAADRRPALDMYSDDGESHWVNNEAREQCFCMLVGADRRLAYQLSYTSKWTLLSRLMRRFHGEVTKDKELVNRLESLFSDIVASFYRVESFSAFSEGLRERASHFGASLRYGLELDFAAYDPSNFFHALRVYPHTEGAPRSFAEMGTGQEQILAIAFACAYAQAFGDDRSSGLILVIEEPEAHLHPLAQRWLGKVIHQLISSNVQVVLTTHSPAFVDLMHLDGMVLVKKQDEGKPTTIEQQTPHELASFCQAHGATKAAYRTIRPFYAASTTPETLSGLFARGCLLVEGPTEALALPDLLERVDVDLVASGIAIVSVAGIGNIARWWRLYTSFAIRTFVLFDRDSKDDGDGSRRADLLTTLNVSHVHYESIAAQGPLGLSEELAICSPDYEHAMRQLFPTQYEGLEEMARSKIGTGKPLVAKYVAARLDLDRDSEGWDGIRSLGELIVTATASPTK